MALAIDLYCGLGGWTDGLLAEGWDVVGFDIERHDYGTGGYPAQLVLQDVRTIHGGQFAGADLIVASPPCQEFSYRAMPWKRAKALPPPYFGMNLFWQCWRIQHEACEASGRYIPMVVENVKGAQPWIGRARAHYGSFYLWGDVESVGDAIVAGPRRIGNMLRAQKAVKVPGLNWSGSDQPGYVAKGFNMTAEQRLRGGVKWGDCNGKRFDERPKGNVAAHREGTKCGGDWFSGGDGKSDMRHHSSKSSARKAASAAIAKIPEPLARYIARVFLPQPAGDLV